ncbi:VID27 cytoplasmic protein-domain-containing protein [Gorgonomyces haynaldii]|nr:VID27 cytoplasmic protein-domain-containing protein [Gorgonomyces haynaldii]
MSFLKAIGEMVFGKSHLIEAKGKLFYLDPTSTTETKKQLLKQAKLTVERSNQPYQYQLIIGPVDEDEFDEYTCLVDQALLFRFEGDRMVWADLSDDTLMCGYEFIADDKLDQLEKVIYRCMIERLREIPVEDMSGDDIQELIEEFQMKAKEASVGQWRKEVQPMSVYATPKKGTQLFSANGDLFRYIIEQNGFVKLEENVQVQILGRADFVFEISVTGKTVSSHSILDPSINLIYYADTHSCSWVSSNGQDKFSELVRFNGEEGVVFHHTVAQCLFETQHKASFKDIKTAEQEYVLNAYEDVEMEDVQEEEEEEEEDEHVPSRAQMETDNETNKHLAVGLNNDRTFIVRGDKVGVFSSRDQDLEFVTMIDKLQTLKGDTIDPSRVMLHQQDTSMLLMNPNESNTVYKLDLERGQVAEEWNMGDLRVENIAPVEKYSQRTNESTVMALNNNALFKIDPRTPNKVAQSSLKFYDTKNKFATMATTGQGHLAVGTKKGEIKLYNGNMFEKDTKNAKTLLAGLGDEIIGMDTTEDGRFVLATCPTYLLLIDTHVADQKQSGFEKSIAKQAKPKRLVLKPEHVAWMNTEISFTPAKFNMGTDQERSIVTSTGKWVISWNFRQVRQGKLHSYSIRQYDDHVVADNFVFGQDRNIIVALQNDVEMISKSSLQTPTKMLKSRSSIVNSPY